ncbi:MAG: RluA family pseudouridine synthase [Phycisphaerae bacterium]|nr:RluA family pseudouridine synthase [Phycisphaerae bacterium]
MSAPKSTGSDAAGPHSSGPGSSGLASSVPTILFSDRWIVVAEKPCGLLSVPGIGPEKADCLVARLQANFSGARIVHRLDRDTSGVMVLARDADVHRELSRQFEQREIEKTYEAIVFGHTTEIAGIIDLPIRKQAMGSAIQIIDRVLGKPSTTRWRTLDRIESPPRTRVELRPLTGRSHQLRVHLQAIGHPIVGDELYAPRDVFELASRLCLHSTKLAFTHPVTKLRREFYSTCPF